MSEQEGKSDDGKRPCSTEQEAMEALENFTGRSDKAIYVGGKVIPVDNLLEWTRWMEEQGATRGKCLRKIADTFLPDGTHVSTVFLGLNHSFGRGRDLWFETMVFGGKFDGEQARYETAEEALNGHQQIVEHVRGKHEARNDN